jgi:glycosyltransferase involved in cell wall biosynthesis
MDGNLNNEKFVSIIVPYYNNEKTIIRAISSILNQSYRNFEIILIDDGSIDDSYSIVNNYIKDYINEFSIFSLKQENRGPSAARNKGILMSRGKYIAFLDADDEWNNNKLIEQISILTVNENIDLLGCNYNIVTDKGIKKLGFVKNKLEKISFKRMLIKHYYATPCVIVKKSVILECGLFNESQHFMEDALLFTKICRDFNGYMMNDFFVNIFKNPFGESGLSGKLEEMEKHELINLINLFKENRYSNEKISFLFLIFIISLSIIKYVRRKIILIFNFLK